MDVMGSSKPRIEKRKGIWRVVISRDFGFRVDIQEFDSWKTAVSWIGRNRHIVFEEWI